MQFPKKINTPSAVKERNNFPLSHVHQTTSDFGLTQVTEFMPLAPTDVVDINLKSFAQLLPLQVPTMGNAKLIHRAFFVPNDFICADWKSFISNHSLNPDSALSEPHLPLFLPEVLCRLWLGIEYNNISDTDKFNIVSNDDLLTWITKDNISDHRSITSYFSEFFDLYSVYILPSGSESEVPEYYDYSNELTVLEDHGYTIYYRFTPLGKECWNIFNQIGFNVGVPSSFAFTEILNNLPILPLLALVKVFVDNFVDPRYNWSQFTTFFRMYTSEYWAILTLQDKCFNIHDMLVLCSFAWFENDLFTSAWQSHSNPSLNGLFKSFSILDSKTDPSVNVAAYSNSNKDPNVAVPVNSSQQSPYGILSQHMLDVLKSVTSYFVRNNIAGSRPIDVLLARFGAKQPEILANMSQYLGSYSAPVKISEVIAHSSGTDNQGSWNALGDKGGQGTINSDGSFHIHFENKWFYGYLIVVSHIMPDIHYFQGLKPHVLMKEKFDFFTPEFDELGSEAMPKKVLFADMGRESDFTSSSFNYQPNSIFGFVPRYYSYKFGLDTLSGDFRLDRYMNSLRPYQMFREVTGRGKDFVDNDIQNNYDFRIFSDKARANYDKIFISQDISEDHFVLIHNIECNTNRPMAGVGKSLIGKIEGGRNMIALNPTGKKF